MNLRISLVEFESTLIDLCAGTYSYTDTYIYTEHTLNSIIDLIKSNEPKSIHIGYSNDSSNIDILKGALLLEDIHTKFTNKHPRITSKRNMVLALYS